MLDTFLLLTPLLLLPIIGLLAFAGCHFQPATVVSTPVVTHVQTVVMSAPAGTSSITADLTMLLGGELIVAAVQWRPLVATDDPSLPTGFTALGNGGPFAWNAMQVKIFLARNPDGNTQFPVTATLPHNSAVAWNLCVSAYSNVNESTPTYSPLTSPLSYTGSNPQTPALMVGEHDLVYAVAFAANSDGTFPGSNSLMAGSGFTARFPQITNPLVEDGTGTNPFIAQVTNVNPDPNAKGFIFAMGMSSTG